MPILNISFRSQDMDLGGDDSIAKKTFKLNRTYKFKYLKLLHIYHNVHFSNIHNESQDTQMSNTILFGRLSFLNSQQSVYYENDIVSGSPVVKEHDGLICLGESVKEEHSNTFRDAYKVLHSGKDKLYINQPFSLELHQLAGIDPADNNVDADVYNATGSHLIQPITKAQFRGNLNSGGQYISLVFEYEEDTSK